MRKYRSRKKQRKSLKRLFGGILHENKNVDDAAMLTAALAARGIILSKSSYDRILNTMSTSVILDTTFKTMSKLTNQPEELFNKAYLILSLLDIV